MYKLLVKLLVKNKNDLQKPEVRTAYATLSSGLGIFLNILLFGAKYLAGVISGSMAIIADAFNNLSDAGSSIITFIGFKLAGKKPDRKHPFGYGRVEYISGFIISAIIVVVGLELGISSIQKIISPEVMSHDILPVIIMCLAILVKLYMFLYNRYAGKTIDSAALKATATDSLTDCIATFVTIISIVLHILFDINIDGYAGVLVSLFILYAGITSAINTISPLLGQPPEKELVEGIEELVMTYPQVKGIHDLMVHDYGPGRLIVSLHAEVDGNCDIFEVHDAIDLAEMKLAEVFNCLATIHMDPIESNNSEVQKMKEKVLNVVKTVYPDACIHDFRMVPGTTHTNLIFDALLPIDCKDSNDEAREKLETAIHSTMGDYYGVVHIDRNYVS